MASRVFDSFCTTFLWIIRVITKLPNSEQSSNGKVKGGVVFCCGVATSFPQLPLKGVVVFCDSKEEMRFALHP
jgi:hypothetical protein